MNEDDTDKHMCGISLFLSIYNQNHPSNPHLTYSHYVTNLVIRTHLVCSFWFWVYITKYKKILRFTWACFIHGIPDSELRTRDDLWTIAITESVARSAGVIYPGANSRVVSSAAGSIHHRWRAGAEDFWCGFHPDTIWIWYEFDN